ncbi:toll/interleukin-1 receptor domain-containing protein [Agriterribacter sp.]|uniref:toll/interleukin-1 receptor domain-containing protein n=1 Tax=Agriterribacter sp. TaxID=2821509 RepID=UPI002BEED089|nr:toll/interleukin-1 receptor domain-containing protein [Agriterribacter sp.]HTN05701.1 toll/interleukin-1 receptor domain-containing protein [Agriterribacter sp.]
MKLFISHSSIDKPFVRKLKHDLELNYINTWFDEDELNFGDSLVDKLSTELFNSSHFLIVLSPNSVKSDWVIYELENALKFLEEETLKKIIPIHYRKCEIPKEIESLLNIDLTKETVYLRNGNFELYGDTYYKSLDKLIRNLRKDDFVLTEDDKNAILGKNAITEKKDEKFSFVFRVSGFKSISNFLANQISENVKSSYHRPIETFIPIVLPIQLGEFFPGIRFGDEIKFINNHGKSKIGNFARFSPSSTLSVTKEIRELFSLPEKGVFKVTISQLDKSMNIENAEDQ